MQQRLLHTAEHGYTQFESLIMMGGETIPVSVTMKKIPYKDSFAIAAFQVDLRQLKAAQRELERQDMLLNTVNQIASLLMSADQESFDILLHNCMGMLGNAVEVDRVYIWQNHLKDGKLCCTQTYEWSEGADPVQGNKLATNIPYEDQIVDKASAG